MYLFAKLDKMTTQSKNFLLNSEVDIEDLGEGVSRQILGYDEHLMLVKVCFEKGAIGYTHKHFHSQCTYVASGSFEVTISGEKQILSIGDGFYAEPDTDHGVICLESGILLDSFSPVRKDFLK